jgi:hypothetical protein
MACTSCYKMSDAMSEATDAGTANAAGRDH